VRLVAGGDAMLSPSVTRTLIAQFGDPHTAGRRSDAGSAIGRLTEREREVAMEVAKGHSNAEIAGRLFMSEATVKSHVSRLFAKLDATNRVQVAITVHDAGLA